MKAMMVVVQFRAEGGALSVQTGGLDDASLHDMQHAVMMLERAAKFLREEVIVNLLIADRMKTTTGSKEG